MLENPANDRHNERENECGELDAVLQKPITHENNSKENPMNDLNIEIPDEECVKLFRYEDDDGVAAYLLLFSEHDMKAVKPRIDA